MQRLYAVSISGKMIYFSGAIPENKFGEIEHIANRTDHSLATDDFCKKFEATVQAELGIKLKQQPITYIFRVRRK